MKLILASTSPRRKEILGFFSYPFTVESSGFDEDSVVFKGDPADFAMETAKGKALALARPDAAILAADTVVYREGKLYLKPKDLDEAFVMLKSLVGKEHQVYTGVCVAAHGKTFLQACKTSVWFHQLHDDQIHEYHKHFEPLDKSGAYAIQKGGSIIVKRLEGCYYNIMGLPIDTVQKLLLHVGIDLWRYLKSV